MSQIKLSQRWTNVLILKLAFVSGFIIMAVELLGGRILAPYFGSSVHVWGSIITVFMLSLSLGYLLGGRWSMYNPSLSRFGYFFILAALTLLPTVLLADDLMDWVFLRIEDPRYGSLLASVLLFFVPTVILGMVAPYSIRLLVKYRDHSGQIAGGLYFVSTLGSAIGTLVTSFYLVLFFEVNHILGVLMLILLLGGFAAVIAHRLSSSDFDNRQLKENQGHESEDTR